MKNNLLAAATGILLFCSAANGQTNYLDTYIGNTVTLTTIGSSTEQVNQPRDLDFKPNSNELWVSNYGTSSGSSVVIFYNAGTADQVSQYRKDTHSDHFMRFCSAIAFGDDGKFACVSEIQNTASPNSTFMGPALWSSDTNIFARVFQNNWVGGLPLGSHLDMLHQSPFAMGIAHDSIMAYWVLDGHNDNICKYDFTEHHGPGYDDHSAGRIWRYIDVSFTRVPNVPSHAILDKATGWLYFIDGGPKQIKRLNTNSGTETGNLTPPSTGSEALALYKKVEFATVEILDTLSTQPCGIDYYKDRLVVSDYTTGDIYLYSTSPSFTLLQTISTGLPGMMGVKVGPDGKIWCVNRTENKVYRLDVTPAALDVSVLRITEPVVENYEMDFFSNAFNVCNGSITPSVEVINSGSTTITDMTINYSIDGGIQTTYNWTGTLTAGSNITVSLPTSAVTNGSHELDVIIMTVNGTADDVDLNNTVRGSFRSYDAPVSLPFAEGFSASTFPPVGWNYIHFNPNNKKSRVSAGGFGASIGSMKMDHYSGAMDITGQVDHLVSPIIDMSNASANSWVRFSVAHARYSTSTNDRLQILASDDCGTTWDVIYNKAGATLSTAPNQTSAFTPNATQWRSDSVSLSAYAGSPELILSWTSTSNFGNNVYVDDIFVSDLSTGISGPDQSGNLTFFPNPTSGNLTITNVNFEKLHIELYNSYGQKVFESNRQADQSREITIDLSELDKGVYLIQVAGESFRKAERILVQ